MSLIADLTAHLNREPESQSAPKKRSIMELQGLGKEIWQGMDAQEYVNQERASWTKGNRAGIHGVAEKSVWKNSGFGLRALIPHNSPSRRSQGGFVQPAYQAGVSTEPIGHPSSFYKGFAPWPRPLY